jgi:signal transduction histidine kinase
LSGKLRRPPSVLARAIRRFAWAVLLAVVVLGLGSVMLSRQIAREEALRDAQVSASGIARGLVSPQLDAGFRSGRAEGREPLSTVLERRMRDGSIVHLRIWDASGRVLWSDEKELVGRRFVLPKAVRELVGTSRSVAELPDSDRPENGGELVEGELLEVYVGARGQDGVPFVLETYTSRQRLAVNTQVIFAELVPIGLVALLLFSLVTLPLAVSLARHVDRSHRHRSELLRRSLTAWSHERRRIASDLHDGVVQDLAAVGYALPSVVSALPAEARQARAIGEELSAVIVESITSLRALMGDLLPSDVEAGLEAAIGALAATTREQGVEVTLDVSPSLRLDHDTARLVHRIVREGLRNVVKHSRARSAEVTVQPFGTKVEVRVADDGQGPARSAGDADRHVGLELLAGTVREVGGDLTLGVREPQGALLRAVLPPRLSD